MLLEEYTDDVLLMIIKNLRIEDIAHISAVSVRFNKFTKLPLMWEKHFDYLSSSHLYPNSISLLKEKIIEYYADMKPMNNLYRYGYFAGAISLSNTAKDLLLKTPLLKELCSDEEINKLKGMQPLFK